MSGVKMRSAELGFRPIDSIAAAVARPWPSAAPNAAMPSPSPAASAIRPLYHSPPPPSPVTSANAGFASNSIHTAKSSPRIRFIEPLLPSRPGSLPLILSSSAPAGTATQPIDESVLVTQSQRDIDGGQHGEHE